MRYQEVLQFWFEDIAQSQWWRKDSVFDKLIYEKFHQIHSKANRCELYEWRGTPKGRLAEIVVLDQFSRNIYRNLPQSFASDALALALSQEAISAGADKELSFREKAVLYLPFMHSESRLIHEVAVSLFGVSELEDSFKFELKHKKIIDEFGRYPHRNQILGRTSTESEVEFLKQPNSRF